MNDCITLEEASEQSGLHVNYLKRLLRERVIDGYKSNVEGRKRWMVSVGSLQNYIDPEYRLFLSSRRKSQLTLRPWEEDEESDD